MITISFILHHGLILKEEQDFLAFYSRIIQNTHTAVEEVHCIHQQPHGGLTGGTEKSQMQMVLIDGLYNLNS